MFRLAKIQVPIFVTLLLTFCLSMALCQKSVRPPDYGNIVRAVQRDDTVLVKKLLYAGVTVNRPKGKTAPGSAGDKTPLMIAAEHGNLTILNLILARGASLEERATSGYFTALYLAVQKGHKGCVAALLAHGANPNTANIDDEPVLLPAAERYPDIATMLIARGANVNGRDIGGGTVLMRAVEAGHLKLVRLLLDKNADVYRKDEGGETALTFARKQRNKDILRVIQSAMAKSVRK